jgi:hypothetical protein
MESLKRLEEEIDSIMRLRGPVPREESPVSYIDRASTESYALFVANDKVLRLRLEDFTNLMSISYDVLSVHGWTDGMGELDYIHFVGEAPFAKNNVFENFMREKLDNAVRFSNFTKFERSNRPVILHWGGEPLVDDKGECSNYTGFLFATALWLHRRKRLGGFLIAHRGACPPGGLDAAFYAALRKCGADHLLSFKKPVFVFFSPEDASECSRKGFVHAMFQPSLTLVFGGGNDVQETFDNAFTKTHGSDTIVFNVWSKNYKAKSALRIKNAFVYGN